MSQFVESICLLNGRLKLLDLHQKRLNQTFKAHYPRHTPHQLYDVMAKIDLPHDHKYKCRFVYNATKYHVDIERYQVKPVDSLKIVGSADVVYRYKSTDRAALYKLFEQRDNCDDIVIIDSIGQVTDTFYANIAFYDGAKWITPSSFLLDGVKRQSLIQSDQLEMKVIKEDHIFAFEKVCLINAMLDLGEVEFETQNIYK